MIRDDDERTPETADDRPSPPDPHRVQELRERMRADRAAEVSHSGLLTGRLGRRSRGERARDLGAYTLIPMLMLAGPAVGYGLGLLFQKLRGGEPWGVVVGVLVGMVAGFRQVFLVVADIQKRSRNRKP